MRWDRMVLSASVGLALAACGGGGEAAPRQGIDFGLVSGTAATQRAVSVTNPLTQPATVRWLSWSGPFTTNRTLLPTAPLSPGGSFDMDVTLTPGAPGPVEGDVTLEFVGADRTTPVVVRMFGMVEEPRVFSSPSTLDFGPVAFGASLERTLTITNPSSASTLRFTGLSAPTPDLEVVEQAFPFEVTPHGSRTLRLRMSPYLRMAALDATCAVNSDGAWGRVEFTARCQPQPGRKVIDLGALPLTGGRTPVLEVVVPAHVWSFHVSAWRPGALIPDYYWTPNYGLPPEAPLPDFEQVRPVVYEGPNGEDLRAPEISIFVPGGTHRITSGAFADTLPRWLEPSGLLPAGGGMYRLQFEVSDDPPANATLEVRFVLKAAPNGVPPTAGTLDLNIWLGSGTGLTPATVAQDVAFQAGLAGARQILEAEGVTFGDIAYYAYPELYTIDTRANALSSVRAAMPREPGLVADRLNMFVPMSQFGAAARVSGPCVGHTNHSWVFAGYGYPGGSPYVFAHEILHYLGLEHVLEDRLPDTALGTGNIMDTVTFGTALTPQQGIIIRAHPFVR